MSSKPSIKWVDVDSSNVSRVAYLEDTATLCVQFHSGGLYSYSGVNYDVYASMIGANSVGRYLNSVIKAMYPYTKFNDEDELLSSLAL